MERRGGGQVEGKMTSLEPFKEVCGAVEKRPSEKGFQVLKMCSTERLGAIFSNFIKNS